MATKCQVKDSGMLLFCSSGRICISGMLELVIFIKDRLCIPSSDDVLFCTSFVVAKLTLGYI